MKDQTRATLISFYLLAFVSGICTQCIRNTDSNDVELDTIIQAQPVEIQQTTEINTVMCDGWPVAYIGYADYDMQLAICNCSTDAECYEATGIKY